MWTKLIGLLIIGGLTWIFAGDNSKKSDDKIEAAKKELNDYIAQLKRDFLNSHVPLKEFETKLADFESKLTALKNVNNSPSNPPSPPIPPIPPVKS